MVLGAEKGARRHDKKLTDIPEAEYGGRKAERKADLRRGQQLNSVGSGERLGGVGSRFRLL